MIRYSALIIGLLALAGPSLAEPPSLNVMSFNIRYGTAGDGPNAWQHRRDLVVETIKQYNPDVVGSQECLGFQEDYILDQLPAYAGLGIGRQKIGNGEMTAIFYKPDRLTPIEQGTFWLSETPEEPGSISWEAKFPRIVSWVKFYDHRLKKNWMFFNTHFSHVSEEARENSAELLAAYAARMDTGAFTIITGDFNAKAGDSVPWHTFQQAGYLDAWTHANTVAGPTHTGCKFKAPDPQRDRRIDWVLFKGPLVVERCETVTYNKDGRYPSDHYPVVATFICK